MSKWIVLIVLLAPTGAAAQPPRPKLQVLQSIPESQLFLLMNLVSDALGVKCDHCHVQESPDLTKTPANVGGWIWDRDDKPAKKIARDMMRMVVDLNAKNFGGTARVTCHTCHRGSTQPERLTPLPTPIDLPRTPVPPPLPSIDRVWTNYVNAVGQAAGASRTAIFSGWDDRSEGRYSRVEIVLDGPDRYRASVSNAQTTTIQGLDGDTGWQSLNGKVVRVTGENITRLRRFAMRYRPIKERPANLRVAGIERIGDRDAYAATARLDPVTTLTMYFDTVSGLLRREMITTETVLLPLQEQVDYEDYRDVNGVMFPFLVRTSDGAPYGTVIRTFNEIRRDVPVDAAQFRPPGH